MFYGQTLNQVPGQQKPGAPGQVENNAGAYVFQVSPWTALERFLILGAEGGTYYVQERKHVQRNAEAVKRCLALDGLRTVKTIVEISQAGRAPKPDSAIFALAVASADANASTRQFALNAIPSVCRTGTHLFHFMTEAKALRKSSRSFRTNVAKWYTNKEYADLCYQVTKYRQRDGFSHKDVLRIVHPKPANPAQEAVFKWIMGQGETALPNLLAFEELQKTDNEARVIELLGQYSFTHEMLPTQWKTSANVWRALLPTMPLHALVRNLATMTRLEVLTPLGEATKHVTELLLDGTHLRRSRMHPLALLVALKTYAQGHGVRSKKTWTPLPRVVDALDEAFYLAFDHVEPTGKRTFLALDVSGSMEGPELSGMPGITPRIGVAAMAMATARVEPHWMAMAFSAASAPMGSYNRGYGGRWGGGTPKLSPVPLGVCRRLDDVCNAMRSIPMGGTDCALPMRYAKENKIPVDTFVVYTDNETWAGNVHPFTALQDYRQAMGIGAKLVIVGMTATDFTIADPSDAGMLDVVGFDTAVPSLLADFSKQELDSSKAVT